MPGYVAPQPPAPVPPPRPVPSPARPQVPAPAPIALATRTVNIGIPAAQPAAAQPAAAQPAAAQPAAAQPAAPRPAAAQSAAAQHPRQRQVGFNSYISKYVPQQDQGSFVFPWTQRYSDSTWGMESLFSGGSNGYDQFVSKYSSMAGKNVSEAGSWQEHSASQAAARMQVLAGIPGAQPAAASTELAVGAPQTSPWHPVQFLPWVLGGLVLMSFVTVLRKSMSRRSARDDGFLLMVDP